MSRPLSVAAPPYQLCNQKRPEAVTVRSVLTDLLVGSAVLPVTIKGVMVKVTRPRRILILLTLISTVGGLWVVPTAESGDIIPNYALKAAGGKVNGSSWGVWLFGRRNGSRCLATVIVEARFVSKNSFCGFSVPPKHWQRAAGGPIGDGKNRRSIHFFLTRKNVGHLNLLIGRRSNHGLRLRWIRIDARVITADQARRARLRRNFGYAVAVVPGLACVSRVVVFDRTDARVEKSPPLQCKF